jgi:hypothetical protein
VVGELLLNIYDEIYEKARPYLDTRENDVHVSISYTFARLLWKMVPEERHLNAFGPRVKDKESRRIHEVEGARIAKEVLDSLNYGEEQTRKILSIIDGHDTRREALSLNDALVKDADKLWRCTPTGVNINCVRFNDDRNSYLDQLGFNIDRLFFTPEAKDMAREALDEARVSSSRAAQDFRPKW